VGPRYVVVMMSRSVLSRGEVPKRSEI
jgi:hypothetical protein